jgi:AAA15 family ATPase/GTPase
LSTGNPRPLRRLGDGINKLLSYLLAMTANPGGIFLLDEIETGFHYSFYPKLWELVANVVKETGSQLVATTHSYECISAAVEGSAKIDQSLLTYVRLGKENNTIVPYVFHEDDLAFALESDMEVR